ncbi:ABC transporter permease [Amycolatopsis roodepoortensis]|uniref:ABC transporter permease n=1 Tax=Amycolatopsis roodepoortensis TaxID=700274 RepID=UPI00214B7582|nr:ABC transporter permease [Amycolatopsis roodepoortensis]UUV29324.1 ABC transporter permease [Amycolatopsis roodepoortensis]
MTHALAAASAARTGQDSVGLLRLYRAELRWIFRRPRTLAVLGLLALIPVIIGVALTLVDPTETNNGGGGNGDGALLASAVSNGFILPVAALTMTLGLLLPLASAMAGADAIAGEAAHGTLRGWLIAPVGRGRLLAIKAFGVATVSTVAVLAMTCTGFVTGLIISGADSMFTLTGSTLSVWDALGRVLLVAAWVVLQLWAIGAVALAISAFTEHPMLVVASVLAGTIVFTILGFLDAVSWLHPFLLNENWTQAPASVLMDPVDTAMLGEGALRAACYIAIGLSIAYARLTTRDG